MKKLSYLIVTSFMLLPFAIHGQGLLKKFGKKAEQMINEKLDKKTTTTLDSTTDRGLRKTYDKAIDKPLDSAFSEKSKKGKNNDEQSSFTSPAVDSKTEPDINNQEDFKVPNLGPPYSYAPGDIPTTEKETKDLLGGDVWVLQLKSPIFFNYKAGGEFQNCISMDPLFCLESGRWELNWANKEITTISSVSARTIQTIKILNPDEMVLFDNESKTELFFKPYTTRKTHSINYENYDWVGTIRLTQTLSDNVNAEYYERHIKQRDSKSWVTVVEIRLLSDGKIKSRGTGKYKWTAVEEGPGYTQSLSNEASGEEEDLGAVKFEGGVMVVTGDSPFLTGTSTSTCNCGKCELCKRGGKSSGPSQNHGLGISFRIDDLKQSSTDPDLFASSKTKKQSAPTNDKTSEHSRVGGTELVSEITWSLRRIPKTRTNN